MKPAERVLLELTVPVAEDQPGTWVSLLRGLRRLGDEAEKRRQEWLERSQGEGQQHG